MERGLEWSSEQGFASTRKDITRWWEARRLRFNVIVGAVGVATWILVLEAGSAAVKPGAPTWRKHPPLAENARSGAPKPNSSAKVRTRRPPGKCANLAE
jgi:hypothetical protein